MTRFIHRRCSHRVLRGDDVSRVFAGNWNQMLRANPHATIFQTSQWYSAWIGAAATAEAAEPIILGVLREGCLRAALALQITRSTESCPTIRPLSSPWADYHEAVARPGDSEAIESLARALETFVRTEGYRLDFEDVVPGGVLAATLSLLPSTRRDSNTTEAINLTDEHHLDRILARREHETKWRRLQNLGSVRCYHYRHVGDILRRLPVFIEMHKQQWAARGDAVAPFDGGIVDATFEAVVRHLAPSGMVMLTELALDSKAIAMYFGFVFGTRYLAYRTSFDVLYRRLSPGHAMLRQMITDFRASGFSEIDLMRGAYAYKRQYTNRVSRNLRFEMHLPSAAA